MCKLRSVEHNLLKVAVTLQASSLVTEDMESEQQTDTSMSSDEFTPQEQQTNGASSESWLSPVSSALVADGQSESTLGDYDPLSHNLPDADMPLPSIEQDVAAPQHTTMSRGPPFGRKPDPAKVREVSTRNLLPQPHMM